MKYTNEEKAREAAREAKMRHDVYRRNAPGGVMSPLQEKRIEMMEEIAQEYRTKAKAEELL